MKLIFEIRGKKIKQNQLENAFKDELEALLAISMIQKAGNLAKTSLGSFQCSEHGTIPKITIKYKALDNVSLRIDGCCSTLIDLTRNLIINS